MYPHLAAAASATAVTVPLDDDERHDLPAIAEAVTVATRLVIVCNPNNPTSTAVPLAEIRALLDAVPRHVCVIVDEAYCEFNVLGHPDASIDLLADHPNLVLLRTFSKVHGLCGLRVGFALCGAEEFRLAVDQVRQPFFCNAAAQAAAVAALEHGDEVTRRVERAVAGRLQLEEGLRGLGLPVAESQANFVWTHLPEDAEEAAVVRGLAERGVLVRAGAALGREHALRVTCGTFEENDRFIAALGELL
jgi:histidinol-phosphate aminotransferase